MREKVCFLIAVFLLLALGISVYKGYGVSTEVYPDRDGVYVMRICTNTANDRQAQSLELLKDYIEENSGNRIRVETYPAGQLGSGSQGHQLLLANEIQGIAEPTAFMAGFSNELTMLDIPFLLDYNKIKLPQISQIFNSEIMDPIRENCEAKGLYISSINVMTYRMLMTKFPVDSLKDLEGKKIRCGNKLLQKEWESLGATGVIISVPELYTALQQGTVVGHESDYNFFNSGKYYEVAPYLMDVSLGTQNSIFLFNQQWIESLPEELQEVVKAAGDVVRPVYEENCWSDVENFRNKTWPEAGVTFCKLSDESIEEMQERFFHVRNMYLEDNPSLEECYRKLVEAAEEYYK